MKLLVVPILSWWYSCCVELLFVAGQETNIFSTETFNRSISHRSDFCPLHNLAEKGDVSLRDALRGQKVTVGLFRYQLAEDGEGSGIYRINELNPGAGIVFLDELASRAGFTWRDSFGILDSPSKYNETWDNLLRYGVDTYDLVGEWFLKSIDRLGEGIVFPEGWYDGSLIMVRKKNQDTETVDFWGFLQPFTSELWYLIVGTTILSGIVLFLMDYINAGGKRNKMELNLFDNIYVSFIGFVGHLIHLPSGTPSRIMIFSISFLFLIIMAAYTANLASFLVIRNAPTIVINDITDAIKNDQTFCVLASSTSEKTLVNEYKGAKIVPRDSIGDTYKSVLAGECDIVLTTIGTWNKYEKNIEYNTGCSLEWVGRVVKPIDAGFSLRDSPTKCSSMLRDVLSLHMVEMKLQRKYDAIWDKLINEKATLNCLAGDGGANENDITLTMANLGGVFIIHLAATTIAIVWTLVAYYCRQQQSSTGHNNNSNIYEDEFDENEDIKSPKESFMGIHGHANGSDPFNHQRLGTLANQKSPPAPTSSAPNQQPKGLGQDGHAGDHFNGRRFGSIITEEEVLPEYPSTNNNPKPVDPRTDKEKTMMLVAVMVGATALMWLSYFLLQYL